MLNEFDLYTCMQVKVVNYEDTVTSQDLAGVKFWLFFNI